MDHRSRSLHHDHLHPVTDLAQVSNTRQSPLRRVESRRIHPEFIVIGQLEIDRGLGEVLVMPCPLLANIQYNNTTRTCKDNLRKRVGLELEDRIQQAPVLWS